MLFIFFTGLVYLLFFFFFQAEDGIRDYKVTGVQTCALPISPGWPAAAIQLAESFTFDRETIGAAARFVSASPTAMRPDAGASISASGVRSPMAKASPA